MTHLAATVATPRPATRHGAGGRTAGGLQLQLFAPLEVGKVEEASRDAALPTWTCRACRRRWEGWGVDPCLGVLAGVYGACCGHGDGRRAYVAFTGGAMLDGPEAVAFFHRAAPAGGPVVRVR